MGYFSDIFESLSTAAKGMRITFAHMGEKPNTVQWPHDPATTKSRTRAELFNNIDDCIGCMRCASACPVDCITIGTVKSTKAVDMGKTTNGKKKTLYLSQFDIDMAKCCYCGLCTDVCPTECLIMTEKFDYSSPTVDGLYYSFSRMSEEDIKQAETALAEEKKQIAAERAAAAKAAEEKKAAEEAAAKAAEAAAPSEDKPADPPAPASEGEAEPSQGA